MTVAELIGILQEKDPNLLVVVNASPWSHVPSQDFGEGFWDSEKNQEVFYREDAEKIGAIPCLLIGDC